jgi:hypothetical protein
MRKSKRLMVEKKRKKKKKKKRSIGCNSAERYVNKEYEGTNHNIKKER